jgi:hypothetical protein
MALTIDCPLDVFNIYDDDDDDENDDVSSIKFTGRYHKEQITDDEIFKMGISLKRFKLMKLINIKKEYIRYGYIREDESFIIYYDETYEIVKK